MTLRSFAVLGVAVGLGACLNTGEPGGRQQNYGFVVLETSVDNGEYVTEPNAIFYRTGLLTLPSTNSTVDNCLLAAYNPDETPGTQFPPTLTAGDLIGVTLSGTETLLARDPSANPPRYFATGGAPVMFQPGDTALIEIPGDAEGFPSWTMKAKTAEVINDIVVTLPASQEIELDWSPATSDGSRMVVSLRYPFSQGGMAQIYCELVDDGSYTIGSEFAQGFLGADPIDREIVFSRWRITAETKGGSILLALSSLQVPTPQSGVQ